MKEHFINEIQNLLKRICAQGDLVENMICRALDAFSRVDTDLATQVVEDDRDIDSTEIRLEEECLKILALYQPVATDLRTVIAILKINAALERMADFAVHIAKHTIAVERNAIDIPFAQRVDFSEMQSLVLSMLRDSVDVMQHSDSVLACRVIERDGKVDSIRHQLVEFSRTAITRTPQASNYYLECIGVARDLERVGDLAVDICEHIVYLETGKIIRHRTS